MKLNRFLALAAIAALVVGAMGFISLSSYAQTPLPRLQSQATDTPDDKTEAQSDNQSEDEHDDAGEAAVPAGQAKITVEEAKAAALADQPGATVIEVELENENGVLVYSVELSNGAEVAVDAGNGAVLRIETEADDGE